MILPDDDHVDEERDRQGREWLKQLIADHIARGNKPDYARAAQGFREFDERMAALPPTGRTEEEAQELVWRHCGRRSIARDFPVRILSEKEYEAEFGT
ncbi:MAG TPA: hypothetical protein VGD01_18975 [Candidatus Elarobacter sp.]|jgi:hypothetical protein